MIITQSKDAYEEKNDTLYYSIETPLFIIDKKTLKKVSLSSANKIGSHGADGTYNKNTNEVVIYRNNKLLDIRNSNTLARKQIWTYWRIFTCL